MLRIVYFRLDAAKCISGSGDGDLDRGKQSFPSLPNM